MDDCCVQRRLGRGGIEASQVGSEGDPGLCRFKRAQDDQIDLAGMDANEQVVGNQAFQFIGQGEFTGAGQVRFFKAGGDTVIEADTSEATAGPEMVIMLGTQVSLQGTDFFL